MEGAIQDRGWTLLFSTHRKTTEHRTPAEFLWLFSVILLGNEGEFIYTPFVIEWDLAVPPDPIQCVKQFAQEQGLSVKQLALATLPGASHWHLSKPGSKGVLEVTWNPKKERFWASCHGNRQAEWIKPMVQNLASWIDEIDACSEP